MNRTIGNYEIVKHVEEVIVSILLNELGMSNLTERFAVSTLNNVTGVRFPLSVNNLLLLMLSMNHQPSGVSCPRSSKG